MGDEPKSRSARRSWRTLFPSSDDAPTPTPPSSPPPALMTLPQSQSASNSTNLLPPPQRVNKSPAQEMDEGKPSQQPRASGTSPGIANSSSANGVIQEEKEKASANDGVQEEEEKEKASANDGVQEEKALKTQLDVAAGKKKKGKGSPVRVWSVEDEFRILECLAAFVKEHGAPPARAQLHDVVLGHVLDKKEFTLIEIYEKVRRLRDRYYTMRTTAAAAAGAPPRGDAEDRRKYELSRKIWGDSLLLPKREIKEYVPSGSGQAPKTCARREFEELRDMYPHLTLVVEEIAAAADRGGLKRAFELIDDSKARELDAKVKKQRVLEMKTQLDRSSAQSEVLRTLLKYMA